MRSFISLIAHLSTWSLFGSTAFGADPAKPQTPSQKIAGEFFFGDGRGGDCTLTLNDNGSFYYQLRDCAGFYEKHDGFFHINENNTM